MARLTPATPRWLSAFGSDDARHESAVPDWVLRPPVTVHEVLATKHARQVFVAGVDTSVEDRDGDTAS